MSIKILIATPCFGGQIYVGYLTNIIKLERLCKEKNILIEYEFIYNESLIPRARNSLVHTFMKSDCTHLLFIDADIEFEVEDIIKLIESDKDVIGGLYPKKTINWTNISTVINNNKTVEFNPQILQNAGKELVTILLQDKDINTTDDIIETRYTGTGILLIKRKVFEEMQFAFPNDTYECVDTKFFRYFDTEVKYGVYLSEDYWFCDRWRQISGKIYLMPRFRCKHWGIYSY